MAVVGVVSNSDHFVKRIKNAGFARKMGFRPVVRGVAMNPRDHAHGGGEGRSSPPVAHKTPYGKLTKVPTNRSKLYRKKKRLFKIFI
jgi:large subunit ribosomal protein L2